MNSHILVVEDDFNARNKLAYRLQYAGYQVTQASDGESAIELLQNTTFDVVLTDIVMGNVDGIQVLLAARQARNRPSVVLLTGYGALDTCMSALRAGAYDYLLKPVSPEQLLACINGALERYAAEQKLRDVAVVLTGFPPDSRLLGDQEGQQNTRPLVSRDRFSFPMQIGLLSLGMTRHEVFFQGEQVHLTPIEYTLLRYLAERCEEICRLQDIVRSTHGLETSEVDAYNLLKTHIRNLRKKISPTYIMNERGKGYKLINPENS